MNEVAARLCLNFKEASSPVTLTLCVTQETGDRVIIAPKRPPMHCSLWCGNLASLRNPFAVTTFDVKTNGDALLLESCLHYGRLWNNSH